MSAINPAIEVLETKESAEEKKPAGSSHAEAIESLSKHFGTGVKIRTNNKGAGQISITFKNEAEFDGIRQLLENG